MDVTLSVVKGKGSINHNNRTFSAENVDPTRSDRNITFVRQDIETAYEQVFGDAIKEYNQKQKRSDRKIDGVRGYMEKISQSKNGSKLFYETVVQVGDHLDCGIGTVGEQKAVNSLTDYMNSFQAANPNLYVFNAVLHMDEASPHLHIDYIPVAKGGKNGLAVKNSLDQALKQQGCKGSNAKRGNATQDWQAREVSRLATICEQYGLHHVVNGAKRRSYSVSDYKVMMNEVNHRIALDGSEIDFKPVRGRSDVVVINKADYDRLNERKRLKNVSDSLWSDAENTIRAEKKKNRKRELELDQREDALQQRELWLSLDKKRNEDLHQQLIDALDAPESYVKYLEKQVDQANEKANYWEEMFNKAKEWVLNFVDKNLSIVPSLVEEVKRFYDGLINVKSSEEELPIEQPLFDDEKLDIKLDEKVDEELENWSLFQDEDDELDQDEDDDIRRYFHM